MAKIIKHDQVSVAGSFHLECPGQTNRSAAAVAAETVAPDGSQVKLVDHDDQASILEVTCSCGHVIQIRCEH